MLWAGSERVVVYLGATAAGVASGVARDDAALEWLQSDSAIDAFEQAIKRISKGAKRKRGSHVLDVQFSGALARPFMFEAIGGLKSLREASAIAASLAAESTGLVGPCVAWLDDWAPGKSCVAVAVNAALRDRLESLVASEGLRIGAMRPWWCVAIDAAQAALGNPVQLLAVEDTDSITVLTCAGSGGYTRLVTHAPKPESVQAHAVLARAALAANVQPADIAWASMGRLGVLSGVDAGGDAGGDAAPPSLVPVWGRWV